MSAKRYASRLQAAAVLLKIVKFAIVGQREPGILADHGLVAGRAKVDDGEPHVPQTNTALGSFESANSVRAAVGNTRQRISQIWPREPARIAKYPAHQMRLVLGGDRS